MWVQLSHVECQCRLHGSYFINVDLQCDVHFIISLENHIRVLPFRASHSNLMEMKKNMWSKKASDFDLAEMDEISPFRKKLVFFLSLSLSLRVFSDNSLKIELSYAIVGVNWQIIQLVWIAKSNLADRNQPASCEVFSIGSNYLIEHHNRTFEIIFLESFCVKKSGRQDAAGR